MSVSIPPPLLVFSQTHHPAAPSCWSKLLPDSKRWTTAKYCRIYKAKIEGLDHYCEWLNVSIGRSNYVPFLLLVGLGWVQFACQAVFGVLSLTAWRENVLEGKKGLGGSGSPAGATFLALACANVGASLFLLAMYSMLLGFHAYLGARGLST
jgi:hypothetical protein